MTHLDIPCDLMIGFAHNLIDTVAVFRGSPQEFMHILYNLSATLIHWQHYC
jgi:hypothetical protein